MRYIKSITLATLLALSLNISADDKVIVVTSNGEKAYAIDKLARIEIGDDLVVVDTSDKGTTYAFDEVQKIVVSLDATSVADVNAGNAQQLTLTVAADGTLITVNGWNDGETATMDVYDTGGRSVLHKASWKGEPTDVSALPHGVYVLRVGTHSAKFRK